MNDEIIEPVTKAIMAAISDDVLPSSFDLAARAAIAAIEASGYRIVKDDDEWPELGPNSAFAGALVNRTEVDIRNLHVDIALPEPTYDYLTPVEIANLAIKHFESR